MRLLVGCIAFTCCVLSVFPLPQQRARAEFDYEGGKIIVEADLLSRESVNHWVAQGDVIITYRDTVLKAPHITYDPVTGEAIAEGGIEVSHGLQRLKGTRAELNLRTNTGTIYNAEGFTDGELYVQAKKLIQTGPDRYTAQDGFLTACEEAVPKWSFTIQKATIKARGNARLTHTLFRIKKIPVFYLPVMLFPTGEKKRSSGFLIPSTGNSNNKGRRISQSFYLVLGRSADLLLREDYFSERGFGHGLTFRTRPNQTTSLEVDWYFVNDRKHQGGTLFNGTAETRLPHGFRAVADFNLVSSFVFRQVFSDNFYTATRPIEKSSVFLTNNFQSGSFNFLVSREETILPSFMALSQQIPRRNVVIRNTPTFNFKFIGQELFNTPLYLDLETSAEGRSRSDRLLETPDVTQRLDLFPQVYFSVPLFQGLRLTPRLGFRETFYSDSLTGLGDQENQLTGANIDRHYLELTMDLKGWGLSKTYQNSSAGGWKHLIEPSIRYRYLTGIDNFDRIIRFDEQDAIVSTHEIEYALFNRIFVKRSTENGQLNHEWLSFKIAQKYFFDPDFNGALQPGAVNQFFPLNTVTGFPYGAIQRDFSPVTSVLRFTPQPPYSFDVRADYDPKFDTFRNFSVTGFLSRSGFYLGATYFLTKELEPGTFDSNQLQAQVTIGNLQRGLSASTAFSYDAQAGRFLTYRSRLNYFWDCCGIAVEFQGFNIGVRQEQQVRFSLFLKGIGTFGTVQRPDSIF